MNAMVNEEWRDMSGLDELLPVGDLYQVSSHGRIRKKGGRVLTLSAQRGYLVVCLTVNGWSKNFRVHRLVASTFHGAAPFPDAEVNHINGVKDDNCTGNLEWASPQENTTHAIVTGLRKQHTSAILSESDVLEIRRLRAGGAKRRLLADKFGVSVHNIKAIDLRKSWRHL